MSDLPYLDLCHDLTQDFNIKERAEWRQHLLSPIFIEYAKDRFKEKLPVLWKIQFPDNNNQLEDRFIFIEPTKAGIPMDWRFYAELEPITKKAIQNETNAEKRRLLMMEFGITDFLEDIRVIDKHEGKNGRSGYGELIECKIDGDTYRFMRFVNGTDCPAVLKDFLKSKKMLSEDGRKLYYHPVGNQHNTAIEAVASTWAEPVEFFHPDGWIIEA